MSSKPISAAWEQFAKVFLPPNVPEMQRIQLRFAFFGGAASMTSLLLKKAHSPDDPTIDIHVREENIKKTFEAVIAESTLFLEGVALGTELSEGFEKAMKNAPSA